MRPLLRHRLALATLALLARARAGGALQADTRGAVARLSGTRCLTAGPVRDVFNSDPRTSAPPPAALGRRRHAPRPRRGGLTPAPQSASIKLPNRSIPAPLNRTSCNCVIGACRVGEVLILMPGSHTPTSRSFNAAA